MITPTECTAQETERLNRIQLEILIKNHGDIKKVTAHLSGINRLADTIYPKAKKTKMKPYWVMGANEEPFLIDPVSMEFHQMMNKAKKQQGLATYYKKPMKPNTLKPGDVKPKARRNKDDKRPIFPDCS